MTDHQDTTTGLTAERLTELRAVAEAAAEPDYYVCDCVEQCADICPRPMPVSKPIEKQEALALLDRITQLERERDEARAEASRIEGRAVEFSRRAEKAEAALERVEKHLTRPLTWAESMQRMPNGQPFPRMEDPETILALIHDTTGGETDG